MSLRAVYGALAAALVMFMLAGATVVYGQHQDAEAQKTLVRFVCAAVEIARQVQTPEALARADRFEAILSDIGESCP